MDEWPTEIRVGETVVFKIRYCRKRKEVNSSRNAAYIFGPVNKVWELSVHIPTCKNWRRKLFWRVFGTIGKFIIVLYEDEDEVIDWMYYVLMDNDFIKLPENKPKEEEQ